MLLTDDEIDEALGCSTFGGTLDARKIEAAILAKLASAELPEKVVIDRHESGIVIRGHTAAQLRQAFAQGAASQLSAEPVALMNPEHTYSVITLHQKDSNEFDYSDDFLAGHTMPLFTLKEPK
jgi:hypothetical protein